MYYPETVFIVPYLELVGDGVLLDVDVVLV